MEFYEKLLKNILPSKYNVALIITEGAKWLVPTILLGIICSFKKKNK